MGIAGSLPSRHHTAYPFYHGPYGVNHKPVRPPKSAGTRARARRSTGGFRTLVHVCPRHPAARRIPSGRVFNPDAFASMSRLMGGRIQFVLPEPMDHDGAAYVFEAMVAEKVEAQL